jgi:hypothetical protein
MVVGPDPFVVVAAGRALFRVDDLLRLIELLRQLRETTVREIMP